MRKFLPLLLLWPMSLLAAPTLQVVTDVIKAATLRETFNPSSNLSYIWAKIDIQAICFGLNCVTWRYCYLYSINGDTVLNASIQATANTSNGGVSSITNPANGKWFITNGIGFDQAGMDWCTQ